MRKQNVHFRYILFYYFQKGKNASQAQKKLCVVYGDEALKEREYRNWFESFVFFIWFSFVFFWKMHDNMALLIKVDETHIKAIIDRRSPSRDITKKYNVSHKCIEKNCKLLITSRNLTYGYLSS